MSKELTKEDLNKIKGHAIIDFVNKIIGAYESGFIKSNKATLAEIYRTAQNHVRDNYNLSVSSLSYEWGDDLAKQLAVNDNWIPTEDGITSTFNNDVNTEINKLLDGVVDYLFSFGNGGDCCPSYDDANAFRGEIERVKELIAEKDAEIAALKLIQEPDNWIPLEGVSKLENGTIYIIQVESDHVFAAEYINGAFSPLDENESFCDEWGEISMSKIKCYQPLPKAKKSW